MVFRYVLLLINHALLSSVYEKMKEKMEEIDGSITGLKAMMWTRSKSMSLKRHKNTQKG